MTDHKTYLTSPNVRAPFTPKQVEILNAYQQRDDAHPYTCENWHGEPAERRHLFATTAGWECRHCSYKQSWAHGFHFEAPQ